PAEYVSPIMLVMGSPGMKRIIKKTMSVTPRSVGIRRNKRRRRYSRMARPSLVGVTVPCHSHPATLPGCHTPGASQRPRDTRIPLSSLGVAAVYRSPRSHVNESRFTVPYFVDLLTL